MFIGLSLSSGLKEFRIVDTAEGVVEMAKDRWGGKEPQKEAEEQEVEDYFHQDCPLEAA
jgi:hypothetical protein